MQPDPDRTDSFRALMRDCSHLEPDALSKIAHIKRFLECYCGDPDFRDALNQDPSRAGSIAEARGINIDPAEVEPLWRNDSGKSDLENRDFSQLMKIWTDWVRMKTKAREMEYVWIHKSIANPKYRAWHIRQVNRCDWEVGPQNRYICHALIAFELSKGCSVGCWFCGVGAKKLQDIFRRTPENTKLWRDILHGCSEEFGPAAQAGFCYWATEPSDNPHYLDYLEDYREIIGISPLTTTAAPLRDLEWTNALLESCRKEDSSGCRFSVISLTKLRQIHEQFTPEQLVGVDLILQNKESLMSYTSTGKYRDLESPGDNAEPGEIGRYDPGTISCVTGFLVNMVDRNIRLVSPCYASERWPLGYRIFWERTWTDAGDFRAAIREAIERHMPTSMKGDARVRFNDCLTYQKTDDGFTLESPFRNYTVNGTPIVNAVGNLVSRGDMAASQVLKEVVHQGHDFFAVSGTLQHMFEKGLIDDDISENASVSGVERKIP